MAIYAIGFVFFAMLAGVARADAQPAACPTSLSGGVTLIAKRSMLSKRRTLVVDEVSKKTESTKNMTTNTQNLWKRRWSAPEGEWACGVQPVRQSQHRRVSSSMITAVSANWERLASKTGVAVGTEAAGASVVGTTSCPNERTAVHKFHVNGWASTVKLWRQARHFDQVAQSWENLGIGSAGKNVVLAGSLTKVTESGNGASVPITSVRGGAHVKLHLGDLASAQFTVCSLSRYTGVSSRRIIAGDGDAQPQWYHGHNNGVAGTVRYGSQARAIVKSINPVGNWAAVCARNAGSTAQNVIVDGSGVGVGNAATGSQPPGKLLVNNQSDLASDFALAEVIAWERALSDEEMSSAMAYLRGQLDGEPLTFVASSCCDGLQARGCESCGEEGSCQECSEGFVRNQDGHCSACTDMPFQLSPTSCADLCGNDGREEVVSSVQEAMDKTCLASGSQWRYARFVGGLWRCFQTVRDTVAPQCLANDGVTFFDCQSQALIPARNTIDFDLKLAATRAAFPVQAAMDAFCKASTSCGRGYKFARFTGGSWGCHPSASSAMSKQCLANDGESLYNCYNAAGYKCALQGGILNAAKKAAERHRSKSIPFGGVSAAEACCCLGGGDRHATPFHYDLRPLRDGRPVSAVARPGPQPRTASAYITDPSCALHEVGLELDYKTGAIAGTPTLGGSTKPRRLSCVVTALEDSARGLERNATLVVDIVPEAFAVDGAAAKSVQILRPGSTLTPEGNTAKAAWTLACTPAAPWLQIDRQSGVISRAPSAQAKCPAFREIAARGLFDCGSGYCVGDVGRCDGRQDCTAGGLDESDCDDVPRRPAFCTVEAARGSMRTTTHLQILPAAGERRDLRYTGSGLVLVVGAPGGSLEVAPASAASPTEYRAKCSSSGTRAPTFDPLTGRVHLDSKTLFTFDVATGRFHANVLPMLTPAEFESLGSSPDAARLEAALSCVAFGRLSSGEWIQSDLVTIDLKDNTCWARATSAPGAPYGRVTGMTPAQCRHQCLAKTACSAYAHDGTNCYVSGAAESEVLFDSASLGALIDHFVKVRDCFTSRVCVELRSVGDASFSGTFCPVGPDGDAPDGYAYTKDPVYAGSGVYMQYMVEARERHATMNGAVVSWVGCFEDAGNEMGGSAGGLAGSGARTTAGCAAKCLKGGYHMMLLSDGGSRCVCTASTGNHAVLQDDSCGNPCEGEADLVPTRRCGRRGTNAVYGLAVGSQCVGGWALRLPSPIDDLSESHTELHGTLVGCAVPSDGGTASIFSAGGGILGVKALPAKPAADADGEGSTLRLAARSCPRPTEALKADGAQEVLGKVPGGAEDPTLAYVFGTRGSSGVMWTYTTSECECFHDDYHGAPVAQKARGVVPPGSSNSLGFTPREPILIAEGALFCDDNLMVSVSEHTTSEGECANACVGNCRYFWFGNSQSSQLCVLYKDCQTLLAAPGAGGRLMMRAPDVPVCAVADPDLCRKTMWRRRFLTGTNPLRMHTYLTDVAIVGEALLEQCDFLHASGSTAATNCGNGELSFTMPGSVAKTALPEAFSSGAEVVAACMTYYFGISGGNSDTTVLSCVDGEWFDLESRADPLTHLACSACASVSKPGLLNKIDSGEVERFYTSRYSAVILSPYRLGTAAPAVEQPSVLLIPAGGTAQLAPSTPLAATMTKPKLWFAAEDYDASTNIWRNRGSGSDVANAIAGTGSHRVRGKGHGATAEVEYLVGDSSTSVNFGEVATSGLFTVCALARYPEDSNTYKQILTGLDRNWVFGHDNGFVGKFYFGNWRTDGNSNDLVDGVTNWIAMCAKNGNVGSLPSAILVNGKAVGKDSGSLGTAPGSLAINAPSRPSNTKGPWAIAEVLAWDDALTDGDMRAVESYLQSRLHQTWTVSPESGTRQVQIRDEVSGKCLHGNDAGSGFGVVSSLGACSSSRALIEVDAIAEMMASLHSASLGFKGYPSAALAFTGGSRYLAADPQVQEGTAVQDAMDAFCRTVAGCSKRHARFDTTGSQWRCFSNLEASVGSHCMGNNGVTRVSCNAPMRISYCTRHAQLLAVAQETAASLSRATTKDVTENSRSGSCAVGTAMLVVEASTGTCSSTETFQDALIYIKSGSKYCVADSGDRFIRCNSISLPGPAGIFQFTHSDSCDRAHLKSQDNYCRGVTWTQEGDVGEGSFGQCDLSAAPAKEDSIVISGNGQTEVHTGSTGTIEVQFSMGNVEMLHRDFDEVDWSSWSTLDQHQEHVCSGEGMLIASESWFSGHHHDRQFRFKCASASGPASFHLGDHAAWSSWSPVDGLQTHTCQGNQILVGVQSVHSGHHEDRQYQFRCRQVVGATVFPDAAWRRGEGWVNELKQQALLKCDAGEYLVGIKSQHWGSGEDRRFNYKCASIRVQSLPVVALSTEVVVSPSVGVCVPSLGSTDKCTEYQVVVEAAGGLPLAFHNIIKNKLVNGFQGPCKHKNEHLQSYALERTADDSVYTFKIECCRSRLPFALRADFTSVPLRGARWEGVYCPAPALDSTGRPVFSMRAPTKAIPSLGTPLIWYVADDFNPITNFWVNRGSGSAGTTVEGNPRLVTQGGFGAEVPVAAVAGDVNTKVAFGDVKSDSVWTVCVLSRYAGSVRGRVLSDAEGGVRFDFGHWNNQRGVVIFRNMYMTSSTGLSGPTEDWLAMCGKNFGHGPTQVRANGVDRGPGGPRRTKGGLGTIGVNLHDYQRSDFAVAEVVVWEGTLSDDALQEAERYLRGRLREEGGADASLSYNSADDEWCLYKTGGGDRECTPAGSAPHPVEVPDKLGYWPPRAQFEVAPIVHFENDYSQLKGKPVGPRPAFPALKKFTANNPKGSKFCQFPERYYTPEEIWTEDNFEAPRQDEEDAEPTPTSNPCKILAESSWVEYPDNGGLSAWPGGLDITEIFDTMGATGGIPSALPASVTAEQVWGCFNRDGGRGGLEDRWDATGDILGAAESTVDVALEATADAAATPAEIAAAVAEILPLGDMPDADTAVGSGARFTKDSFARAFKLWMAGNDVVNAFRSIRMSDIGAADCDHVQWGMGKIMCDLFCLEEAVREGNKAIISNIQSSTDVVTDNMKTLTQYTVQTLDWHMAKQSEYLNEQFQRLHENIPSALVDVDAQDWSMPQSLLNLEGCASLGVAAVQHAVGSARALRVAVRGHGLDVSRADASTQQLAEMAADHAAAASRRETARNSAHRGHDKATLSAANWTRSSDSCVELEAAAASLFGVSRAADRAASRLRSSAYMKASVAELAGSHLRRMSAAVGSSVSDLDRALAQAQRRADTFSVKVARAAARRSWWQDVPGGGLRQLFRLESKLDALLEANTQHSEKELHESSAQWASMLKNKLGLAHAAEAEYREAASWAQAAGHDALGFAQSQAVIHGCSSAAEAATRAYSVYEQRAEKAGQALREAISRVASALEELRDQAVEWEHVPKMLLSSATAEGADLQVRAGLSCGDVLTAEGQARLSRTAALAADLASMPSLALLHHAAHQMDFLAGKAAWSNHVRGERVERQRLKKILSRDVVRAATAWSSLAEQFRRWANDLELRKTFLGRFLGTLGKRCPVPAHCSRAGARAGEDPVAWVALGRHVENQSSGRTTWDVAEAIPLPGDSVRRWRCVVEENSTDAKLEKGPVLSVQWPLPEFHSA